MDSLVRLAAQNIRMPRRSTHSFSPQVTKPSLAFFFPHCIGAVDGSHYPCRCPIEEQDRYRNRKGQTSMNVCGIVDFTGRWIYMLAGWEGSAHDQRVYNDAWDTEDLMIPKGSVVLGDGGYGNARRTLVPYRGTRYHLQEYVRNELSPTSKEELFNLRHSQLRMVVERAFGRHKQMFKIFGLAPQEGIDTHLKLVYATAAVMNFVLDYGESDDTSGVPYSNTDVLYGCDSNQPQAANALEPHEYDTDANGPMNRLREEIANQMWEEWSGAAHVNN